jgi:hypothetical protein
LSFITRKAGNFEDQHLMPVNTGLSATEFEKLWSSMLGTRKGHSLIHPVFTGVLVASEDFVKKLFATYLATRRG